MQKAIRVWMGVLACALTVLMPSQGVRSVVRIKEGTDAPGSRLLKLVSVSKKNHLRDLTADGKYLLLYQTSTPARGFTFPLNGRKGKADQPDSYDDVFRVVERETGREIGRKSVRPFPLGGQFVPATTEVFYIDPDVYPEKGSKYVVWDFVSGETRVCHKAEGEGFFEPTFLNQHLAIGTVWKLREGKSERDEVLGTLSLPDCTQAVVDNFDPNDPQKSAASPLVMSPDMHHLAYDLSGSTEVLVREMSRFNVIKRIKAPAGLHFESPLYTSANSLVIPGIKRGLGWTAEKRYILVYETTNYTLSRQLDVTDSIPPKSDRSDIEDFDGRVIAVSPDSRILAIGYKEMKEGSLFSAASQQAFIVLYDLSTGAEIGRAFHPELKQTHKDPFKSKLGYMTFTPDGKYLLTTTEDTFVWRVETSDVRSDH